MESPDELPICIARTWPPAQWQDVNIVVAISGGADSVALLHALCRLKPGGSGNIIAAHLNHQLRGEESELDQRCVQQVCEELGVELRVGREDVASKANDAGDGLESAARHARYEFLLNTAEQCGARYVATAHTAGDQVETILHRILRGTGVSGLAGMPFTRPLSESVTLVRPMLEVGPSLVRDYVHKWNLSFRHDRSNDDLAFTRNRLRHDLLPKLREEYNPSIDEALLRLSHLAFESQRVIAAMTRSLMSDCVSTKDHQLTFDCQRLAREDTYLITEVIKSAWSDAGFPQQGMGKSEWEALTAMAQSAADASRDLPGNVRAEKKGDQLVLMRP